MRVTTLIKLQPILNHYIVRTELGDSLECIDSQVLPDLLHGNETRVWGDTAYSGQREGIQQHAPEATSFIQAKAHRHRPLSEVERARNRTKSEGPCQSRTCIFGDEADLRVGPIALPWVGEECQLALRHLRVDESVPGATAPLGGDVERACPPGAVSCRTVDASRRRRSWTTGCPPDSLLNYPRNRCSVQT